MLSDIYFYDMYLWLMKVHVLRVVVDDVVRQQPRSGALSNVALFPTTQPFKVSS